MQYIGVPYVWGGASPSGTIAPRAQASDCPGQPSWQSVTRLRGLIAADPLCPVYHGLCQYVGCSSECGLIERKGLGSSVGGAYQVVRQMRVEDRCVAFNSRGADGVIRAHRNAVTRIGACRRREVRRGVTVPCFCKVQLPGKSRIRATAMLVTGMRAEPDKRDHRA